MLNPSCTTTIIAVLAAASSLVAGGCCAQTFSLQQEAPVAAEASLLETLVPATLNDAQNTNHRLSYLQRANQIDAPKYYHLNALLYKPPDSRGGDDENLRPLSGAREEEGAAIDSLLRAMRRKQSSQADGDKEMPGANDDNADGVRRKTMAANNDEVGPEDEATIQRKSIDSLDGSSRLRSRGKL